MSCSLRSRSFYAQAAGQFAVCSELPLGGVRTLAARTSGTGRCLLVGWLTDSCYAASVRFGPCNLLHM